MSEIAKMAIKWPKLKNDYFLLKKQFYYLSIIFYQLSFINIYNSRPRNIENSITSDETMKIMILSKMAQKWSKWPTEAFINHRLGWIGDIESLKRFWKRQVFSQWFGVESPHISFLVITKYYIVVKTPTPTQHNTTVGFDMKMTVQTPPTTHHTNFSGTSRRARELKFGTDTHQTNLIKIT